MKASFSIKSKNRLRLRRGVGVGEIVSTPTPILRLGAKLPIPVDSGSDSESDSADRNPAQCSWFTVTKCHILSENTKFYRLSIKIQKSPNGINPKDLSRNPPNLATAVVLEI